MNIKIETSKAFERFFKKLAKKHKSLPADLGKLKLELLDNPGLGVDLGNNVHKIRLAITSKGRGKSAGARIITHQTILYEISENIITLVIIYDKSDQETVSKKEILSILKSEGII